MPDFKFFGTEDHDPVIWSVEATDDGRFDVIESYDGGETWICNCTVASKQEGWDFIAAWFAQFYEES